MYKISPQLDQGGQALVPVSDTGVGLPTDKADQIFNAFFTTKPQGSGMGLAICRSIVESHGGRLWGQNSIPDGALRPFHFARRSRGSDSDRHRDVIPEPDSRSLSLGFRKPAQ